MTHSKKLWTRELSVVAAIFSSVFIIGCANADTSAQSNSVSDTTAETRPSPGKPGASIELASAAVSLPTVGTYTQLITLQSTGNAQSMSIELLPSEGLDVSLPAGSEATALNAANQAVFPVRILANMEGRLYLNVLATAINNGETSSRALSIPVQVGNGTVATTPDGERVISMPAQEN